MFLILPLWLDNLDAIVEVYLYEIQVVDFILIKGRRNTEFYVFMVENVINQLDVYMCLLKNMHILFSIFPKEI
jgi:hypothetical protein